METALPVPCCHKGPDPAPWCWSWPGKGCTGARTGALHSRAVGAVPRVRMREEDPQLT